jgi:ubiquinone/menaquinone biosynthesis C-methylase UbiE
LDSNEYFEKYYIQNKAKFPHIVLDKFIHGMAEDMRQVPDESVDAVVATQVLCSVTDLKSVLREVYRVLVKGGRFYTIEHVEFADKQSIWRWLQVVVNPVWKILFGGCHITRDAESFIRDAGFSSYDLKYHEVNEWPLFVQPNIYGFATK